MMADDKSIPGMYETIRKWSRKHSAMAGVVALAVLVGLVSVWMTWEKVKTSPGGAWLFEYLMLRDLPKAPPNRFSVMVAHLEHDTNHEQERLIVETLKELKGIVVLPFDWTISLEVAAPEGAESHGHRHALDYLKQSGASVLIWGTVLSRGGKPPPKLFWTEASRADHRSARYDAPRSEELYRLPVVFWEDLSKVLGLVAAARAAQFSVEEGRHLPDELRQRADRVRTLLKGSENLAGWDADTRATTRLILAGALRVLGEQTGTNEPIEEAVEVYTEALNERTWEHVPLQWAATQNNLGNALFFLGERETGTAKLQEAVDAYKEALNEYTHERVPLQWAMTQNNLGCALSRLGERESETESLQEAVIAIREALKERTRKRVPLQWAITQNNLGNALFFLGERETGTEKLEEAVVAYREALKKLTRQRVPLRWAMTESNLGNALCCLGRRESGTKRLKEAVAAYRQALKKYTRERVPLDWAKTQNNLGNALLILGERETGTERLEEAVAAYKAALEVFASAQASYYIEMASANLRRCQELINTRKGTGKSE